jgi:hypothetical protein
MRSYLVVADAVLDLAEEMGITNLDEPVASHKHPNDWVELLFGEVRFVWNPRRGFWVRSPTNISGYSTEYVDEAAMEVAAYHIEDTVRQIVGKRGGGIWDQAPPAMVNLARLAAKRLGVNRGGLRPDPTDPLTIGLVRNTTRRAQFFDALVVDGWFAWDNGMTWVIGKQMSDHTWARETRGAAETVFALLKYALFDRVGIPAVDVPK